MWFIKTECCFSVFSFDSGDSTLTCPGQANLWWPRWLHQSHQPQQERAVASFWSGRSREWYVSWLQHADTEAVMFYLCGVEAAVYQVASYLWSSCTLTPDLLEWRPLSNHPVISTSVSMRFINGSSQLSWGGGTVVCVYVHLWLSARCLGSKLAELNP